MQHAKYQTPPALNHQETTTQLLLLIGYWRSCVRFAFYREKHRKVAFLRLPNIASKSLTQFLKAHVHQFRCYEFCMDFCNNVWMCDKYQLIKRKLTCIMVCASTCLASCKSDFKASIVSFICRMVSWHVSITAVAAVVWPSALCESTTKKLNNSTTKIPVLTIGTLEGKSKV